MKKPAKPLSCKRFLTSFVLLCLAALLLLAGVVYLYDPFLYYRMPQGRFIVNNYRFTNAGIVKNADYDAAVIGSSMTQNFDLDLMRAKLGVNPIKVTVGGMSVEGMDLTYTQLARVGKAKTLYVCLDLPSLNKQTESLASYATYLYDDNPLNDYKYLLGYETWMRLLPLSVAFNLLEQSGRKLPQFYGTYDIDHIGEWYEDAVFGAEILKKAYRKSSGSISAQSLEQIDARMAENTDRVLDPMLKDADMEFVFFFPPYSQLFWHEAQSAGYFDAYLTAKYYIAEKLSGYDNVRLYDFQALPQTADLDHYKDVTHYDKSLNNLMVECFATGFCRVDETIIAAAQDTLRARLARFQKENAAWLY